MKRPRDATAVLLLLLALVGVTRLWHDTRTSVGIDFYQFWAAGRLLERGAAADFYTDAGRARHGLALLDEARASGSEYRSLAAGERRVLETYSTPFLYTLFRLGTGANYERDLMRYRATCLAVLVLGLVALCRLAGHGWPATAAVVGAFTFWFEPALSDLQVGNVNAPQLAALALFLVLPRAGRWPGRDLAAGAVLGLATAFKPTTIFVVALVLFSRVVHRRQRRLIEGAAGLLLGGLVAFVSSAAVFGTLGAWSGWLAAVLRLPDAIITVEMGNFGLARVLAEWTGHDLAPLLVPLFLALAALAIWLGRRAARGDGPEPAGIEDATAVAFGCLVMLLSLRLVWLHYFVLAAPAVVLLLGPQGPASGRWAGRVLPVLAVAALCTRPLVTLGVARGYVSLAALICLATATLFGALFRATLAD